MRFSVVRASVRARPCVRLQKSVEVKGTLVFGKKEGGRGQAPKEWRNPGLGKKYLRPAQTYKDKKRERETEEEIGKARITASITNLSLVLGGGERRKELWWKGGP